MVDHLKQNEGWEMRMENIRERVTIVVSEPVFKIEGGPFGVFETEEVARLIPKFQMIQRMAEKLCWGMVKGTIKYPSDDYTPAQWLDHLFDEQVDGINYQMLFEDSIERRQLDPNLFKKLDGSPL